MSNWSGSLHIIEFLSIGKGVISDCLSPPDRSKALCFRLRLFIDALWSPAGKGLTSWLSFVMSICEAVTFPLVSLVRCGA